MSQTLDAVRHMALVQPGGSKERIFESTLVILTPKRLKSNKKSASASQKVKKPKPWVEPKPRVEPTPADVEAREQNRHEYERHRNRTAEHKEWHRRFAQAKQQEAKSLGLCVACGAPPIPDQPRCEVCAEQHRQYHKQARERARQQREQTSGQTKIFYQDLLKTTARTRAADPRPSTGPAQTGPLDPLHVNRVPLGYESRKWAIWRDSEWPVQNRVKPPSDSPDRDVEPQTPRI